MTKNIQGCCVQRYDRKHSRLLRPKAWMSSKGTVNDTERKRDQPLGFAYKGMDERPPWTTTLIDLDFGLKSQCLKTNERLNPKRSVLAEEEPSWPDSSRPSHLGSLLGFSVEHKEPTRWWLNSEAKHLTHSSSSRSRSIGGARYFSTASRQSRRCIARVWDVGGYLHAKKRKNVQVLEQNLDCEDLIKVRLIALSFKGYTLIWWITIALQIRMKVTLIRVQLVESQEVTMARFLNGLNRDIQDVVEFHKYTFISTLVHQASKAWEESLPYHKLQLEGDKSPKKGRAPFKGHKEKKDEIHCDFILMEVTHVLLGRPWQFDRKVIHDGVTIKISFVHKGNKVTLKPLTPRKVIEDQIKMEKKIEEKKRKRKR
ncbi:hypothetical protein CR513_60499, partial [Mucuna pruriens]